MILLVMCTGSNGVVSVIEKILPLKLIVIKIRMTK